MSISLLIIASILVGASMMLILMGLGVTVILPGIDRWSRRFFIVLFSILAVYISFSFLDGLIFLYPGLKFMQETVYYLETLFASVLSPMIAVFLLHSSGERTLPSPLFRAEAVLWTALFIMLNMTLFTPLFYYVTPDNQFCRGPLYPLMIGFLLAMLLLNLAGVFRRRRKLSRRYFYSFLAGLIPMTVAVFIHLFRSVFVFYTFGVSICALSMFGIILLDRIEQHVHQQREIAHQRASIMVLQMRPHFIYNTMMSIYYLCKQDPDLAQLVTLNFTTYLRKNFTAIASEKLIPFSEELEHTRAYLAVEQAQFEGSLFVEYDTPHTDFRLPPLTLQPIVENAVKHGMDPDSEYPLRISIRTQRTASGSEITVENNGTDYEPSADSEPHIALKNIRQRLEVMCRGKMTIIPRENGGTVVKVTIS